ncbi:MAG: hypothetical protein ACK5QX_12260, partial [bacterium]
MPLPALFAKPEKRRRLWKSPFKRRSTDVLDAQSTEMVMGQSELTLHENIIKLRNLEIYDVMVPRADIIGFEVETEASEILIT